MKKWLDTRRYKGKTAAPVIMGTVGAAVGAHFGGSVGASIGYMLGAMLGQMLFPVDSDVEMPAAASYPIQHSDKGTPIPIVYGSRKVAGNIIWVGDIIPYTIKHEQESGKGGIGGGSATTSEVRYTRSFLIAIAHGPGEIRRVWAGKDEIDLTFLTSFNGADNGTDINALTGEDFSAYRHMICAFFSNFELGNTQAIPNFNFEIAVDPARYPLSMFALVAKHYVLGQDYQVIVEHNSMQGGAVDIAQDGRYLVTDSWINSSTPPIHIYDRDNINLNIPFDWGEIPGAQTGVTTGARFSKDGNYVYVCMYANTGASHIVKFDAITGSQIWMSDLGDFWRVQHFFMKLDEYENVYLRNLGPTVLATEPGYLNGSTGEIADLWTDVATNNGGPVYDADIYGGFIYWSGRDLFDPFSNIWKCALPTSQGGAKGAKVAEVSIDGNGNFASQIRVNEFGVFIIKGDRIIKYNHELTIKEEDLEIDTGTGYLSAMHFNKQKQLIVQIQGGEFGTGYEIIVFDKDLNRVDEIDVPGFGSDGGAWAAESASLPSYVLLSSAIDINPLDVIQDLLINGIYGAGISPSYLDMDSFNVAKSYCSDNNLLFSFVLSQQKPVLDWIDFICSHFQGYIFMSEGKIHFGIYKDESSEFTINQDNLIVANTENPDPPVDIVKRKYSQTFNRIELTWTNRDAEYDTSVAVVNDEVDQRVSGKVRKKTFNMTGVTNNTLAQYVAYRLLFDSMYRYTYYTFSVSYQNMLLEVGNVGTLSDGFSIVNQKIRITSIAEDKDGKGLLIKAVDDHSELYMVLDGDYFTQDPDYIPSTPLLPNDLVEPTISFLQSRISNKISLSFAPMDSSVNGWNWYYSFDNISYSHGGRVTSGLVTDGWNVAGRINSSLSEYSSVIHRQDETFEVSLGDSVGLLDTAITDDEFFSGSKLCKIGNEIIAYRDIEDASISGKTIFVPGAFLPDAHYEGYLYGNVGSRNTVRTAMPFTASENFTINSIVIEHSGENAKDILVAIYDDTGVDGRPGNRLGISVPITQLATGKQWEKFDLITPVNVIMGNAYWMAYVQEASGNQQYWNLSGPGYTSRVGGSDYGDGLPDPFGASSTSVTNYNMLAVGVAVGDGDQRQGPHIGATPYATPLRRASKLVIQSDYTATHVSIEHSGDTTDEMILGIYDSDGTSGHPGTLLAITASVPMEATGKHWQDVELITPFDVVEGHIYWLGFVLDDTAGGNLIYYYTGSGTNGVSKVNTDYEDGLTDPFGTVTTSASVFNIQLVRLSTAEDVIIEIPPVENRWRISNLIRGMFGTKATTHSPSDVFATLDVDAVFEFPDPDIGRTVYFKAITFYGDIEQSIGNVSDIDMVIRGYANRPAPATIIRLTPNILDRTIDTYIGTSFDLYWCNNSKDTGFNLGGFDIHSDIITGQWNYGDDEALLKQGNGVMYGSYLPDAQLEAVNVRLETITGGLAFESDIGVVETLDFDISDISNSSVLVVKITPRRSLATLRINEVIITGE